MSITAEEFCGSLTRKGYGFYTGVPCSFFKHAINHVLADPAARYVAAANEGAALGVAAGAATAGIKPVVMLQNSGFGNLVNPLTSLSLIYDIPALICISMRAYPDPMKDEPQHRIMGTQVPSVLDCFGVPHWLMPDTADGFDAVMTDIDAVVSKGGVAALLVQKGAVTGPKAQVNGAPKLPLRRIDAIGVITDNLEETDAIVSTAGMMSRELFSVADRQGNLYVQGSMGHAMAIALGAAITTDPGRRIIALDGDGAVIMHMGSMSTIGAYAPPNLVHIILDNEAYGTTGNQATTSSKTRLEDVALACGYRLVFRCADRQELETAMRAAKLEEGPICILVKINCDEPEKTPRITSRYTPIETTQRFSSFLREA